MNVSRNVHEKTVSAFGDEWSTFTQSGLAEDELSRMFEAYFEIFPWEDLPPDAEGFDMGCGSGRWARLVAPRVGRLHCIDASSQALNVARRNLSGRANVTFHHATTDSAPLPPGECDFGYSLGVLHHVPDTAAALRDCVRLLRPGAPFLVYLYYRFDNRPAWYRGIWRVSDLLRRGVHRLPGRAKTLLTDALALLVYWPLSRAARLLERIFGGAGQFPLANYSRSSLHTLRTDSRDRFGTPLEQRFTRAEIAGMMRAAGLTDIRFSDAPPYWCAVGRAKAGYDAEMIEDEGLQ
jgi:SAM-dependent methyltransferase